MNKLNFFLIRQSAKNHEHIKDVIKPYDWTYTTSYTGTLKGTVDNQVKLE